jgi:SAM-dependent methyltransferase
MFRRHWEAQAPNWLAWARTNEHDAYHDYAPGFFEEIVPHPAGWTLEIGCGEGRVTRDLTARGHDVMSIDVTAELLDAARSADPGGRYVRADAARLPFSDGTFALVVAYNSLMDLDDMPAGVRDAARVLTPGGRLAVCITHPFSDAGTFESRTAGAAYRIDGSYLAPRVLDQTFERDGLTITFAGMAHPLETYARAFEDAGFVIERIREPGVDPAAIEEDPSEERWTRMPMFLFLRLVKLADG